VEFTCSASVSPSGAIRHIRLTRDNKLVIAGPFTSVYGTVVHWIAQLYSDRKLDQNFGPTGINYPIDQIAVAADGTILFASERTNSEPSKVRRLTSIGTLDVTFTNGTADYDITRMEAATDGRIYVGGEFTTFNGFAALSLARLTHNGVIDTNFHFMPQYPKGVYSIWEQRDGKILLATGSGMPNGATGIVRLNSDGTHDTNFTPSIQTLVPADVLELPHRKVLAAGIFIAGTNQSRLVLIRLNPEPLVIESWTHPARELHFRGPSGQRFVLECATNLSDWQSILTNFFTAAPFVYSNTAPLLQPAQYYRVRITY